MEIITKKLLIEAENSIWVMQNNPDNREIVEKFAIKLYKLSLKILEKLEISNAEGFI